MAWFLWQEAVPPRRARPDSMAWFLRLEQGKLARSLIFSFGSGVMLARAEGRQEAVL